MPGEKRGFDPTEAERKKVSAEEQEGQETEPTPETREKIVSLDMKDGLPVVAAEDFEEMLYTDLGQPGAKEPTPFNYRGYTRKSGQEDGYQDVIATNGILKEEGHQGIHVRAEGITIDKYHPTPESPREVSEYVIKVKIPSRLQEEMGIVVSKIQLRPEEKFRGKPEKLQAIRDKEATFQIHTKPFPSSDPLGRQKAEMMQVMATNFLANNGNPLELEDRIRGYQEDLDEDIELIYPRDLKSKRLTPPNNFVEMPSGAISGENPKVGNREVHLEYNEDGLPVLPENEVAQLENAEVCPSSEDEAITFNFQGIAQSKVEHEDRGRQIKYDRNVYVDVMDTVGLKGPGLEKVVVRMHGSRPMTTVYSEPKKGPQDISLYAFRLELPPELIAEKDLVIHNGLIRKASETDYSEEQIKQYRDWSEQLEIDLEKLNPQFDPLARKKAEAINKMVIEFIEGGGALEEVRDRILDMCDQLTEYSYPAE